MTTYYPLYVLPTYNLPVVYPDCTATAIQTIYNPVTSIVAPQVYTLLCPYDSLADTVPCIPDVCVPDVNCVADVTCVPGVTCIPDVTCVPNVNYTSNVYAEVEEVNHEVPEDPENYKYQVKNPIELFLSLPKELFPSARSQVVDPNPIIDQFCQLPNINGAVNWILDLEFGLPIVPVTRSIAVYNVKNNNVFCRNSLRVHPGFDTCCGTFKREILGYYKRLMYQWYKGYMLMNHDKSIENFQTWLVLPMNFFGMGWR